MSGEKVVPDQYYTPAVDQWRGGKIALFERSTILRVLDEEIAELEESRIDTFALRSIRSRFTEDVAEIARLRSEPATTEREPDGWVGDYSNDVVGTALLVVHPDHPQARKEPFTRPVYIGSPPPEEQTRAENEAPTENEGRWFDRGYAVARAEVEDTTINVVVEGIKAAARAETLAVIRQALPAMTFKDSWGVDAVYVDSLLAGLDRLSTEGGGS